MTWAKQQKTFLVLIIVSILSFIAYNSRKLTEQCSLIFFQKNCPKFSNVFKQDLTQDIKSELIRRNFISNRSIFSIRNSNASMSTKSSSFHFIIPQVNITFKKTISSKPRHNYQTQNNTSKSFTNTLVLPIQKLLHKSSSLSNGSMFQKQRLLNKSLKPPASIMSYDGVSCEPLFPEVLLFNRIFKTGSTTLGEYLVDSSSNLDFYVHKETTEDWYKNGDSSPYPETIERAAFKAPRVAFIAHFYFRSNLAMNKSYTYINILRHPIHRIVSHYKYMRIEKIRPAYRIRELKESGQWNETLKECIKKQHRGCEDNVMTRFLCGVEPFCKTGSKKALTKAKLNMKRFYASIGLLEHIHLYLKILKKRLPSFFSAYDLNLLHTKGNSDKNYFKGIPKKVLNVIRKRNKADISLYKFAMKRFKAELMSCGLEKLK